MTVAPDRNPFRPSKFEQDHRPLIWVSSVSLRVMRHDGSYYVCGARGSGKTSILKSLETLELKRNPTLLAQLSDKKKAWAGVYIHFPSIFMQTGQGFDWRLVFPTAPDTTLVETLFVSTLIETAAIEQLCRTAVELREAGWIEYSLAEATTAAEKVLALLPDRATSLHDTDPLSQVSRALLDYRSSYYNAISRGDQVAAGSLMMRSQPMEFLASATDVLLALFRGRHFSPSDPLRFKIALDECDYLTEAQQRILNSLVRHTKAPIDWILAYTPGGINPTATVFGTQGLSGGDRAVVDLDALTEADFNSLCKHITSYRTYYSLSPPARQDRGLRPTSAFSLQDRLGNYRTNHLLSFALERSTSQRVSSFREAAQKTQRRLDALQKRRAISKDSLKELEFVEGELPLFQHYVISRLGLIPEEALSQPTTKETFLAALRNKQRGAMLELLEANKITSIPYAGARIITALADGSIRDFLDLMAEIYEQEVETKDEAGLLAFCTKTKPIEWTTQRQAAVNAAEAKYRGIEQQLGGKGRVVARLIDCLGTLTRMLQVDPTHNLGIRTPERGIFRIDDEIDVLVRRAQFATAAGPTEMSLSELLTVAQRENLVITDGARLGGTSNTGRDAEASLVRFRLHRRFAPRYGFSYRGAIADVRIPAERLYLVLDGGASFDPIKWATEVKSYITKYDPQQTDLFEDGAP